MKIRCFVYEVVGLLISQQCRARQSMGMAPVYFTISILDMS